MLIQLYSGCINKKKEMFLPEEESREEEPEEGTGQTEFKDQLTSKSSYSMCSSCREFIALALAKNLGIQPQQVCV